jgi:putative membrane protein
MLTPSIQKNDKKAKLLIGIFSAVVFVVVVVLNKFTLNVELPFDKHIFALANAILNSAVCVLLIAALVAVKSKNFILHKNLMLFAMLLSILFLVSYIAHHLFAGETVYGDSDFNGKVDNMEAIAVGNMKPFYLVLLFTHIILAATSLPFILFTAYRGLTGEYEDHKRKAKRVWPIWFYVAATGPLVYFMIKPYYH